LKKLKELHNAALLETELRIRLVAIVVKLVEPVLLRYRSTLFLTHNAGFFSCVSVALSRVIDQPPMHINSRLGLCLYKKNLFSDPWPKYFVVKNLGKMPSRSYFGNENCVDVKSWWSAKYEKLPFENLRPYLDFYFMPSEAVRARKNAFIDSYRIQLLETIGVHIRGTDKSTEWERQPIEKFTQEIDKLLQRNQNFLIYLQTDEIDTQTHMLKRYPDRIILLKELRAVTGAHGAHFFKSADPEQNAIDYFASVLLLSECKYLITHTGNGAMWEVLYRGNSDGVVQS